MITKTGYTTCNTCNKFAYITSAAMLSQLPDGYYGELCQQCNTWGCALDKLEPKPTKAELYKDFHISLSELRKEWKRARFCVRNRSDEIAPRDAIRVLVLEERVKFLEKKWGGKQMTTSRPTPRELHIENGGAVLFITTETADADEWIQTEARLLGELFPDRYELRKYSLWIRPTYNTDEVVTYLESYLKA